jgi:hypothetical protein
MGYTLGKLCEEKTIGNMVTFIEDAVSVTYEKKDPFERRRYGYFRKDDNITDYQNADTIFNRFSQNDRVFPLETVEIQGFNQKHDTHIQHASIHTGYFADELTRSLHVAALTLATDIFFRSNNYNTSTSEGRQTLAHELIHVSQYEEKDVMDLKDREKLEAEAESAEKKEAFEVDPLIRVKFNGKTITIRKSDKKKIIDDTVDGLLRDVEDQKYFLREEEYLKFLCTLEEYSRSSVFTVVKKSGEYDMAEEIERKFKKRLRF